MEGEGGNLTSGGRLNHVADGESLDGLVLGGASRAVGAPDGLDVAAALLVAAVVLPLLGHFGGIWNPKGLGGCEASKWDRAAHTKVAVRLVGCRRREKIPSPRAQVVIFGRGTWRMYPFHTQQLKVENPHHVSRNFALSPGPARAPAGGFPAHLFLGSGALDFLASLSSISNNHI